MDIHSVSLPPIFPGHHIYASRLMISFLSHPPSPLLAAEVEQGERMTRRMRLLMIFAIMAFGSAVTRL
jgi:hypothetical protein